MLVLRLPDGQFDTLLISLIKKKQWIYRKNEQQY